MSEFEFHLTVRVEAGKDTPDKYQGDEYALQFATDCLARILQLDDTRSFAENAYSKLKLYSVSLKAGERETHHEPLQAGQPEAEDATMVGFSHEEIEAATVRNAEQP